MRQFRILVFLLIAIFCTYTAYSQCCCSGPDVRITDGGGVSLAASDVKTSVIPGKRDNARITVYDRDKNEAKFQFYVGCGDGNEALTIEHLGVTMRIRFKLHGDFGHPKVDVVFATGDYVAEFEKERDDEGARTVVLRAATAEEMKEIEPPPPAEDAPQDQTAQAF